MSYLIDQETENSPISIQENKGEIVSIWFCEIWKNFIQPKPIETIKKAGVSVDAVPEYVQNALTRDYSGLMKAIDKKKGNK